MNIPFSLPGLNSYRGRYLYLSIFALILIGSYSYTSWKEITQAAQLTQQNISVRQNNTHILNGIINQFQLIRAQVYKYSLITDSMKTTDIYGSVIKLLELAEQIDITAFDDVNAEILNNFIVQIPVQLHNGVVDLISIRSNTGRWIPATLVMSNQLSPLNESVVSHLDSIINDNEILEPNSHPLLTKFLQFKNLWLSTVSEFRLLAANRLGVFDQPTKGIWSRHQNLLIRIDQLNSKLIELQKLVDAEQYSFVRDFIFPELMDDIEQWVELHEQAKKMLMQEYWRQDILALQQIEALLKRYNQSISVLQQELSRQSERDIQSLNQINRELSINLILFSLAALLLATVGFFFIDRNILRPIARTTRALYLQSQGLSQELDINSTASETRDLVDAFNQMSEQIRQQEQRLDFMAHHDALTGLPNRLMFNERLEHAIKLTERSSKLVCLMLLDLDRFKLINDTLGHLFGDKLLQQAAIRLRECIRTEDTIARLGGDEFSIILENIDQENEAEQFAKKILQLLLSPFI